MQGNSPEVASAQDGPHRRLLEWVERHRRGGWRQPLAAHSQAAFAELRPWLAAHAGLPLLLDSGCGNGASTEALAGANAGCAVLGIDKSAARLAQRIPGAASFATIGARAALLRAPLQDLWRLLLAEGVRPTRHLLWYPNPWPKPEHLGRRWHGHPVLPTLLALGGEIELRSNWRVYVDEFALALAAYGWRCVLAPLDPGDAPATPFERKYRDSGHALWRLTARPG